MADAAPADALFGDSGAGDDIFGTTTASVFDAPPQETEQKPSASDVPAGDIAGVFGSAADDASDPFAGVGKEEDTGAVKSALDDYASQGWYDDDGKFHLYEDPTESYTAPAATTSTPSTTQTKSYTPSAYAPPPMTHSAYAPPAANSYTPAQTNKYAPPVTNAYAPPPTTNAYGPTNGYTPPTNSYAPQTQSYAPPATTNTYTPSTTSAYTPSNSYTPSANAYAPSTNSYAPPTTNAYGIPSTTSSYAPSVVPGKAYVPPPPPPAAYTAPPAPSGTDHLKYRSASANAYDPPIPAAPARRRIDSSASSVSAASSPALAGPFGQTLPAYGQSPQPSYSESPQPAYGQIGHGAPPPPPPQGRNRVGSQGSVLSGGVPQRTLSPADALGPGRVGSPLAGPARVGSPLVRTVSPYDPPPSVSTGVSPVSGPGSALSPPTRHASALSPSTGSGSTLAAPPPAAPPKTGTKSAFDPPPPRTGTKSAFDPPLTGRKNAFDPPLTGRKNAFDPPLTGRKSAFDPPLTGRKNAFDPPPPRTGTKSAFDPPVPRSTDMQRQASQPNPPIAPSAPPPRPKSAYDPPPRPASGASSRYGPALDTSAPAAKGPRSAPGTNAWDSPEVDGRGSLDGADSGYKSRTSMSSERAWMDDDPEGGSAPVPQIQEEQSDDPEGGVDSNDPEGGASYDPEGGDYDESADRTVVAPLLGVAGPTITATAPTPLASPGASNIEFREEADPEGGEPYVPAAPPRTASPAVPPPPRAAGPPSRTASPAVPPPPRTASPAVRAAATSRPTSRTTSISSASDSPFGHKSSFSISKRPAPVVVEPVQTAEKYVIDNQPYTPMYGQSPYGDVQTSPPKKSVADPYAPSTAKPADPYAPATAKPTDPYAPTNKPATDPYAPTKPADPHQPSKYTGEPTQRVTYSPPNGLARVYTPPPAKNGALGSRQSSMASVKDAYAPPKDPYAPAKDPYAPPAAALKDPYAPSTNAGPYAPSMTAARDIKRPASTAYDPPMPAVPQPPHASSYTPGVPAQMYAPRRDSRAHDQGDASDYEGSSGYVSRYNYSSVEPYQPTGTPSAYVPVSNGTDPLGRHDSRAPIIAFGFGGRFVTSFPGLSELTGGFDVSLGRKAAPIQVRTLHKIIPESALETSTAVFPGPLFSDPGSPTKSLVSVGVGGSGAKTKKAAVIKYLGERAEEIERGLGYLAVDGGSGPGPSERSKAEGKLVIVLLLKVMVENDGRLSGTPAIDAAVRHALVPRLSSAPTIASPNSQAASFTLASALDPTATTPGISQLSGNDSPVATYKIKPSALDKIQEFLLQGERRAAYHYALDERMWAHAMLISSSLDKEAWKEVVNEFIRSELGVRTDQKKPAPFGCDPSVANGREPLRVAYSLFAGQGAAAMQELLPPKNLAKTGADSLMPPTMPMVHATPISPNFPQPVLTSNVPAPVLLQWQEIAATILSNQADSTALTALGDYLLANKWTEAAHVCYLLSPATSPVGGLSTPSVRMVLLGSESPAVSRNFEKDDDAIIFTEIAEYAHSLVPTAKGQEAYAGIPHLQAYKLIRAARLAEMGHLTLSTRYCEAIATSTRVFGRPSPFFTPCFAEQCKELTDRLSGVPQLNGSGSWIGKKVAKPSLDSIGGWLSGGLTKLIAGDEEVAPPPVDQGPKAESGAFSHYSAISSANTSQTPSPNASVVGLPPTQPGVAPPRRSGSAMAQRPGSAAAMRNGIHQYPNPTDRSASAMDYLRPPANKAPPQAFSASAATTTFYQADVGYRASASANVQESVKEEENGAGTSSGSTYTPWWGGADESSGPTPTATTFFQVNDAPPADNAEGGEGFISLMDTFSPMPSPIPTANNSFRSSPHHHVEDEDEEDLGFGNSKKPKKEEKDDHDESGSSKEKEKEKVEEKKEEPKKDPKEAAKAPELKPASSWLGRWWSRKETDSPGPVKANLGEQMSLVYDKELKRWVNPNAPRPEAAAAPPPPPSRTPSRAQAGSPAPGPGPGPSPLGRTSGESTPPTRPQSANSLAPPPGSGGPRRVRSTLNESFGPSGDISSSEGGTPPLTMRGPPSRGQTPGAKRNIRSRYVDVFAEPSSPSPSS
ncbi:COPII coat assembly protein Sec-16 [Ceratobasidium sp. AG-Ba]|nr:COPII coat assembly protein Sec-16 [Ceratobasidium sp. AG-Ba]